MQSYVVVVPAYNEELSITACIQSITAAAEDCSGFFNLQAIIVCINGCTDNTEVVLGTLAKNDHRIVILKNKSRGYVLALNRSIEYIEKHYPKSWMIKLDADSRAAKNAFWILLNELQRNLHLIIAGGHPLPDPVKIKNGGFLAELLALRSIFPMSEISQKNVLLYHQKSETYAKDIDPEWQIKSKIYFHGRFWATRNYRECMIPSSQIGDDVYLAAHLYTKFGFGAIKMRYDANCFFLPMYTFSHHWKTYRRISEDIKKVEENKELSWYVEESKTKLNWPYILSLKLKYRLLFLIYAAIVNFEKISFRLVPYHQDIWKYKTKTNG